MICTKNEELNDLFILKRSHGLARELNPSKHQKYRDANPLVDFNFLFLTHGYNFRNTELHAVIGIEQLKHLDRYIDIRNRNHKMFLEIIAPIQKYLHPVDHPGISSFCLPFVFKNATDKERFVEAIKKNNIEYRPIISGNLLRQPCFTGYGNFSDFVNAETLHLNGFYIGNNQFVGEERLALLKSIIQEVF
jgi:CDP-6-deoxy-D-xylo-4-hexulose-3-dehydrase